MLNNINIEPALIEGQTLQQCPSCKSGAVVSRGRVPEALHFGTLQFMHAVNRASLHSCSSCGLYFKSPCLSIEILDRLYKSQPRTTWEHTGAQRRDFLEILRFLLDRHEGNRLSILDVGCFDGSLLSYLRASGRFSEGVRWYGVEPSLQAAEAAQEEGIEIIGESVFDLQTSKDNYDVILMVDVFEHIQETLKVMTILSSVLAPNGVVLVVTGNLDSRAMRSLTNRRNYVCMPEHLVFLTKKHALWLSRELDLGLQEYTAIARSFSKPPIYRSLVRNIAYWCSCFWLGVVGGANGWRRLKMLRGRGLSSIARAEDHVLAVFRKTA